MARQTAGVGQNGDLCFLLSTHVAKFFNRHERIGDFAEAVLCRLLVLRERLVETRHGSFVIPEEPPALKDRLKNTARDRPDRRPFVDDVEIAAESADGSVDGDIREKKRLRSAD